MLSDGFQLELKRLFTLFCGQSKWLCWIIEKESSVRIAPSDVSEASLEERVLLRQLQFQGSTETFHRHHPLFQLPVFQNTETASVLFQRLQLGNSLLILCFPKPLAVISDKFDELIRERLREWNLRSYLAQHVSQLEERAESAENRLNELRTAWEEQVTALLEDWKSSYPQFNITMEDNLPTFFLNEFSEQKIKEQLDLSLSMLRYLHPTEHQFYLTRSAIVQPAVQKQETAPASLTGSQRAAILLDKYEESARSAQKKGIAVNGKSIAENLQPSISPPAITDALKKNRKSISTLIYQHPDKWPLLRKHLKPVKELHERNQFNTFANQ